MSTKSDWQKIEDPSSGHAYYWNIATNEVSWSKPECLETPKPPIAKALVSYDDYCSDDEEDKSPENPTESNSDENEDEETLLMRLRRKAFLLKELGGDVSKHVETIIASKTVDDIIAEIESETPPDRNEYDIQMEVPKVTLDIDACKETNDTDTFKDVERLKKVTKRNVQPIKLSARGKELIKTSCVTAKARATNFVQTEDGLKPIEESPLGIDENHIYGLIDENKDDLQVEDMDIDEDDEEMSAVVEIVEAEIPAFNLESENCTKVKRKRHKKYENSSQDTCRDSDLNKKMLEASNEITEKLKFWSKSEAHKASPLQIMAIQIETLLGAWHSGALAEEYMHQWLEASEASIADLEEKSTRDDWKCEWDRSYGRYYYRNVETGAVQWDTPGDDESKREFSNSGRTTKCDDVENDRDEIGKELATKKSNVNALQSIFASYSQPDVERPATPPPPTISADSAKYWRKRKNADSIHSSSSTPFPPPPPPSMSMPQPPPPPLPYVSSPQPPPPPSMNGDEESKRVPPKALSPTPSSTVISVEQCLKSEEVKLSAALDSFYSEIDSIQCTATSGVTSTEMAADSSSNGKPKVNLQPVESILGDAQQREKCEKKEEKSSSSSPSAAAARTDGGKKKKKIKFDASLNMRKKGVESMIAKWQNLHRECR